MAQNLLAPELHAHAAMVIAIGFPFLPIRVVPFITGVILRTCCAVIVADCGAFVRLGVVLPRRCAILHGALLVPRGIMATSTNDDVGHCRRCCYERSETKCV